MRNSKHKINESLDEIGFNLIKPSIERWIDDRMDSNHPTDISGVREYTQMQDKGFNLCTKTGDYLAKDLTNSYLKTKISWLDVNFDLSVSKQGKIAIAFKSYEGFNIIIHYIQYDFSKTFTNNLGLLSKETAKYLSDNFTSQSDFNGFCLAAVQNAKKESKKTIYLDLINNNPENKPVFEKLSLRGYSILTESDELQQKMSILSLSNTDRKIIDAIIARDEYKYDPNDELPSVAELEGMAVRGVWFGNVLTIDDTGEQFRVTDEAPTKCHAAYAIRNGFLNKL